MKYKAVIAGVLAVLIGTLCYTPKITVATEQIDGISAVSYVVMDVATKTVLFAQDENEQMPMASTTKIMTTLLALEQPLDQVFEVDEASIQVEGSSMGLLAGDQVTLLDLCYGMMLSSGNDSATLTANLLAGSTEAFATLMNQKADEIGMTNTNFVNPSGLPDDQHYSTAYDMALLACEAIQNEQFAAICSTESVQLHIGDRTLWLENHNKLLTSYEGCIGMKTGYTIAAGRCLVSVAEQDGRQLVCVTLNAPDDWNDHTTLLDAGFACETYDLWQADQAVEIPVTGGNLDSVTAYVQDDIYDYDEATTIVLTRPFLYAPVQAGEQVGELVITTIQHSYSVPLIASETVISTSTQTVSVFSLLETLVRPLGFTSQ